MVFCLFLGNGGIAAFIAAPICGWPGQLHVLKLNAVSSFALPVFLCSEVGMWEEPLSALLDNMGKK